MFPNHVIFHDGAGNTCCKTWLSTLPSHLLTNTFIFPPQNTSTIRDPGQIHRDSVELHVCGDDVWGHVLGHASGCLWAQTSLQLDTDRYYPVRCGGQFCQQLLASVSADPWTWIWRKLVYCKTLKKEGYTRSNPVDAQMGILVYFIGRWKHAGKYMTRFVARFYGGFFSRSFVLGCRALTKLRCLPLRDILLCIHTAFFFS